MGRKSIAPQRQNEILDAFERCVMKYGFTGSSTHRISEEAGMKQPMVAHYFGNSAGYWMHLQAEFDIEQARAKIHTQLGTIIPPSDDTSYGSAGTEQDMRTKPAHNTASNVRRRIMR